MKFYQVLLFPFSLTLKEKPKMKTKLLLFAAIIFIISSCNESHFANKVMKDIGNGKYVTPLSLSHAISPLDVLLKKEVFNLAEVKDREANEGYEVKDFEYFFQANIMFDDFKLIESKHTNVDMLELNICDSSYDKDLLENWNIVRDYRKADDKNFKHVNDKMYISTNYKMVDFYEMKYKITSKQFDKIALLNVIKIPKEGYRVTSFRVL